MHNVKYIEKYCTGCLPVPIKASLKAFKKSIAPKKHSFLLKSAPFWVLGQKLNKTIVWTYNIGTD